MSTHPRHRAPRVRSARPVLGAVAGALAIAMLTSGSTSATFTDKGRASVGASSYTVPFAVVGAGQVSGTGEFISTRIQASCAAPSAMAWRWRDHVTAWGSVWNPWSAWSTATSEPGWSAWSTSDLQYANVPAEVQWEVRCGLVTWTSTASQHGPLGIVRTA